MADRRKVRLLEDERRRMPLSVVRLDVPVGAASTFIVRLLTACTAASDVLASAPVDFRFEMVRQIEIE
jgi:hypothetical protein